MKKIFLIIGFLFFNFDAIIAMQLGQNTKKTDLKENLTNLTNALNQLNVSLKEEINVPKQEHIALPYELDEMIILNLIPTRISTKEMLQKTLLDLSNLETLPQMRSSLQNKEVQKNTVQKIFNNISPGLIQTLKLPMQFSQNQSMQGTIKNALYYIKILQDSPRESQENVTKAIKYLIDHKINPNLFIASETLLIKAIQNKNPEAVKFLIDQGADINLSLAKEKKTKKRSGQIIKKIEIENVPFIVALNSSLSSAEILLEQPNLDSTKIEQQLPKVKMNPLYLNEDSTYKLSTIFLRLLKANKFDIANLQITYGQQIPFLAFAITLFQISGEKNIELIRYLLDQGARSDEEYYTERGGYFSTSPKSTPYQDALQTNNKELIELFENYRNKNS